MDIFVPVVVKKSHPTHEKQRNMFLRLNMMWQHLEFLEVEDVLDAN